MPEEEQQDDQSSSVSSLASQLAALQAQVSQLQNQIEQKAESTGNYAHDLVFNEIDRLRRDDRDQRRSDDEAGQMGKWEIEDLRHRVDELYRRRNQDQTATAAASSAVDPHTLYIVRLSPENFSTAAGNATTTPSVLYTVMDYTTLTVIATGVAVTGDGQRIVNATLKRAGALGFATIVGGVVTLFWANEGYDQTNCA